MNNGRQRVAIEGVKPEIDCGRFPIKRTVGEAVVVEADVLADGHDAVSAVLLYRKESQRQWSEVPMEPLVNDRWRARFTVSELGRYFYTLRAWIDRFASWRRDTRKKYEAKQNVSVELLAGLQLVGEAAAQAKGTEGAQLKALADLVQAVEQASEKISLFLGDDLAALMYKHLPRLCVTQYHRELPLVIDPEIARFSAWYEMFPRSCGANPGEHGTFRDCEARLPYIAEMGFDVLYLSPIHPIGRTNRKGKNNAVIAQPTDPGSPWAIGATEGGHKEIHPQLGSLHDFRRLVKKAREYRIEVALDIAYQCTPDHPYAKEHPAWFRHRSDGTIQYAENPPKKYEDIYPFDFETEDWKELWEELKSIVTHWIKQGVKIFRVDNPHTKPFPFWEWMIAEMKKKHPDVILLSEAFTRPKVMYRLAKLGFTQSYTYFAWRNTKWELMQYFTELTQTDIREYFRPNLWPNTPDILTQYLQTGGPPAFMARLVLAATLGASYGIYGPAFELMDHTARQWGSEEYLDSEKYQIRHWDLERSDSLRGFISRVNYIRRENPALHHDANLRFHSIDNDQLICYSKHADDFSNIILVTVNLDPYHTQSGWVDLSLRDLHFDPQQTFQVHDLLSGARYFWQGNRNYVELNPQVVPAHIFRMRRRIRTEQDFEYFM